MKALSIQKERILVRRSKVIELYSQGLSEREMAKALNIPRSTINLDVRVMRRQARTNVKTFVEDRLPFEHESLMIGIRSVLKKARTIINDERSTEKAVSNALHLVLDCYAFKRQLLMDITYIALAIRDFVEEYYWVILKIWSLLRTEIENRRREPGPPNYMEHLENMENNAAEFD